MIELYKLCIRLGLTFLVLIGLFAVLSVTEWLFRESEAEDGTDNKD